MFCSQNLAYIVDTTSLQVKSQILSIFCDRKLDSCWKVRNFHAFKTGAIHCSSSNHQSVHQDLQKESQHQATTLAMASSHIVSYDYQSLASCISWSPHPSRLDLFRYELCKNVTRDDLTLDTLLQPHFHKYTRLLPNCDICQLDAAKFGLLLIILNNVILHH